MTDSKCSGLLSAQRPPIVRSSVPLPELIGAGAPGQPRRRVGLVYGVGKSDSDKAISKSRVKNPIYQLWVNMLSRCYSSAPSALEHTQVYSDCSVDPEWHSYSAFESWVLTQDYEGKSLDKDLLYRGNKVYSSLTCVFVSKQLNAVLLDSRKTRGEFPLGVTFDIKRNKFQARVWQNNSARHLGRFETAELAHKAWQLAKSEILIGLSVSDPRIRKALDERALQLRFDAENGIETTKL